MRVTSSLSFLVSVGSLLLAPWCALGCGGGPTNAEGEGSVGGSGGTPETGTGGETGVTPGVGGAPTSGAGGTGGGDTGVDITAASAAALAALVEHLAIAPAERPILGEQGFANVPLTASDAQLAAGHLWDDFAQQVKDTRAAEVGATEDTDKSITLGEHTLRYYQGSLGEKPATGWSLFLGMHGGGATDPSVNDSQWENHLGILKAYAPKNAIVIAPRAPGNTWDMWFSSQVDVLFARLIENMIVWEGVDPNRVYLTGYSAGGDGTYQLGPRMADYWAGAAMSAGHPNDASPLSLRNVPFAIHVGGADTAYDRHLKAAEWGGLLDDHHDEDPNGYFVQWQVHDGLPHWMNLAEKVSIPFLEERARNPLPARVVWRQAGVTKQRSYWLFVSSEEAEFGDTLSAEYTGQTVTVTEAVGVSALSVRLSDKMMSLDQDVVIIRDGKELFRGAVTRTIGTLSKTLDERHDPELMFSAEVAVVLD